MGKKRGLWKNVHLWLLKEEKREEYLLKEKNEEEGVDAEDDVVESDEVLDEEKEKADEKPKKKVKRIVRMKKKEEPEKEEDVEVEEDTASEHEVVEEEEHVPEDLKEVEEEENDVEEEVDKEDVEEDVVDVEGEEEDQSEPVVVDEELDRRNEEKEDYQRQVEEEKEEERKRELFLKKQQEKDKYMDMWIDLPPSNAKGMIQQALDAGIPEWFLREMGKLNSYEEEVEEVEEVENEEEEDQEVKEEVGVEKESEQKGLKKDALARLKGLANKNRKVLKVEKEEMLVEEERTEDGKKKVDFKKYRVPEGHEDIHQGEELDGEEKLSEVPIQTTIDGDVYDLTEEEEEGLEEIWGRKEVWVFSEDSKWVENWLEDGYKVYLITSESDLTMATRDRENVVVVTQEIPSDVKKGLKSYLAYIQEEKVNARLVSVQSSLVNSKAIEYILPEWSVEALDTYFEDYPKERYVGSEKTEAEVLNQVGQGMNFVDDDLIGDVELGGEGDYGDVDWDSDFSIEGMSFDQDDEGYGDQEIQIDGDGFEVVEKDTQMGNTSELVEKEEKTVVEEPLDREEDEKAWSQDEEKIMDADEVHQDEKEEVEKEEVEKEVKEEVDDFWGGFGQ